MNNSERYEQKLKEIGLEFAYDVSKNTVVSCLPDQVLNCSNCLFGGDCKKARAKWLYEECKEPILTPKEKEYLEGFLNPFKYLVIFIMKSPHLGDREALHIMYSYNSVTGAEYKCKQSIMLPPFIADCFFQGMTLSKKYTLEDLGLFDTKEGGE